MLGRVCDPKAKGSLVLICVFVEEEEKSVGSQKPSPPIAVESLPPR